MKQLPPRKKKSDCVWLQPLPLGTLGYERPRMGRSLEDYFNFMFQWQRIHWRNKHTALLLLILRHQSGQRCRVNIIIGDNIAAALGAHKVTATVGVFYFRFICAYPYAFTEMYSQWPRATSKWLSNCVLHRRPPLYPYQLSSAVSQKCWHCICRYSQS